MPHGETVEQVGERVRRLRRVVEPDTDHIHHQLLRVGLSRRDAVLLLYGTSVCLSLLALFMASDAK